MAGWSRIVAVLVPTVAALGLAGCGGATQVTTENREVITSLATAVSAQNAAWLDSNVRLIEKRRSEGQLSEAEYQSLTSVVTKARAGNWKDAEAEIYALREAQAPTAEDLENNAKRQLAPDHRVPKSAPKRPQRGRAAR